MRIPRARLTLLASASLLVAIGAACSGGASTNSSAGGTSKPMPADHSAVGAAPLAVPAGGVSALDVSVPEVGPKIVKTAEMSIDLPKGSFGDRFQRASAIAARHGGFVAASNTTSDRLPSGGITLRVPASQFETALGELRELGTVRTQHVSGQDVTAQYVDLQARLRNWQAQESVLLKLFDSATSIEDSIQVQRQLQEVQLAIEQIQGQLNVLNDQTDFSTITLSMREIAPKPTPVPAQSRLSRAWHDGWKGFVAVATAIAVALGYASPFLLVAIVAGGMWLVLRRRRPRVVTG